MKAFFKKIFRKKEQKGVFLRKSDDGCDLFYPWGYPGKGYYVTAEQSQKLAKIGWLITFIFYAVLICMMGSSYIDALSGWTAFCVMTGQFIIYTVVYVIFVSLYTKRLKPFTTKENKIPHITFVLGWVAFCSAGMTYFLYWSSSVVVFSPIMFTFIVVYFGFFLAAIYFFLKVILNWAVVRFAAER